MDDAQDMHEFKPADNLLNLLDEVSHRTIKKEDIYTYISRAVLLRMLDEEGGYCPSRHPLAHETDGEAVRYAEEGNNIGMPETFPRHDFVSERL
jgi:hypothetical protein